jgi:hypothetical protein
MSEDDEFTQELEQAFEEQLEEEKEEKEDIEEQEEQKESYIDEGAEWRVFGGDQSQVRVGMPMFDTQELSTMIAGDSSLSQLQERIMNIEVLPEQSFLRTTSETIRKYKLEPSLMDKVRNLLPRLRLFRYRNPEALTCALSILKNGKIDMKAFKSLSSLLVHGVSNIDVLRYAFFLLSLK